MRPAALLLLAYRAVMARRTPLAQLCPDVWVVLCQAQDGPPFVYKAYYGDNDARGSALTIADYSNKNSNDGFRFWVRRYEGSREVIDGLGAEEAP